jgi:hypothetical protein
MGGPLNSVSLARLRQVVVLGRLVSRSEILDIGSVGLEIDYKRASEVWYNSRSPKVGL